MVTFTSSIQLKGKEGSQDYEHSMNKTSTHNVFIRKSSYLTMETKFSMNKESTEITKSTDTAHNGYSYNRKPCILSLNLDDNSWQK